MTSASLLIVLIIGIIVGALTGLALGGSVGELPLTVIAGLLGTIIAAVVRNMIMVRGPAGLFSSILLAMLMITYHTNPGEPPRLRK
jgi:uncharacterized membrane protein YeaQ/YmgE (transglycosylase-associated protein family)